MGFITNAVRFSARFLFYLDMEYELQNWITIKVSLHGFIIQEDYQIKQPWQQKYRRSEILDLYLQNLQY